MRLHPGSAMLHARHRTGGHRGHVMARVVHGALLHSRHARHPGHVVPHAAVPPVGHGEDRAWLDCRSEEHTSELQSLMRISYAVFCLINTHRSIQYSELIITY